MVATSSALSSMRITSRRRKSPVIRGVDPRRHRGDRPRDFLRRCHWFDARDRDRSPRGQRVAGPAVCSDRRNLPGPATHRSDRLHCGQSPGLEDDPLAPGIITTVVVTLRYGDGLNVQVDGCEIVVFFPYSIVSEWTPNSRTTTDYRGPLEIPLSSTVRTQQSLPDRRDHVSHGYRIRCELGR